MYSGKIGGCIREKVDLFGHMSLYSSKVVVFGQSSCILENVVLFVQNWLYYGLK